MTINGYVMVVIFNNHKKTASFILAQSSIYRPWMEMRQMLLKANFLTAFFKKRFLAPSSIIYDCISQYNQIIINT